MSQDWHVQHFYKDVLLLDYLSGNSLPAYKQ